MAGDFTKWAVAPDRSPLLTVALRPAGDLAGKMLGSMWRGGWEGREMLRDHDSDCSNWFRNNYCSRAFAAAEGTFRNLRRTLLHAITATCSCTVPPPPSCCAY